MRPKAVSSRSSALCVPPSRRIDLPTMDTIFRVSMLKITTSNKGSVWFALIATIVYHEYGGRLVEFSPPELEARVLRELQTVPRELHTPFQEGVPLSVYSSALLPGSPASSGASRLSASSFFTQALRRLRTAAIPCSIAHLLKNINTMQARNHMGSKIASALAWDFIILSVATRNTAIQMATCTI